MDFNFEVPQFKDFLDNNDESFGDEWFDEHMEDEDMTEKIKADHEIPPVFVKPATASKPARQRVKGSHEDLANGAPRDPPAKQETRVKQTGSAQKAPARPGSAGRGTSRGMSPRVTPKMGHLSASVPSLHSQPKSSEELEMEKIKAMRAETAKARKLAQESYKKIVNQANIPLRSGKPATMPQGFHFSTDSRLKKSGAAVSSSTSATSGECLTKFTSTLRSSTKTQSKSNLGHHPPQPTRPQPFKLSQPKNPTQAVKFVSQAEKIANFSKKTPQRWKSVSKVGDQGRRGGSHDRAVTRYSPHLTAAQSPALACRGRSRPVHALSREQQEMEEYERHQKEQFKARPVNYKVLQMANLGVPAPEPRPATVPSEFALTRRRSMSTGDLHAALEAAEQEDHHRFKAKPVNPKLFKGPLGVKRVDAAPPTVPESPAFALKNRVRMPRVAADVREEVPHAPKINPVPHVGIPYQPKREHKHTVPEPFGVEERSREMLQRREQKIQQLLEEERKAREFQASDLPSFSPDQLPPKHCRPTTKPEPFDLAIDKRGQGYQELFQMKQQEEERRKIREAAIFKAAPSVVAHKKAFQPKKGTKPLTEIDDFKLNTDMRAASREHFDQWRKHKEAEIEALKRQRQEQHERDENAMVARLRQETVHHATGITKYKPAVIKPSTQPPTIPQTPNFSQRFRPRTGSH